MVSVTSVDGGEPEPDLSVRISGIEYAMFYIRSILAYYRIPVVSVTSVDRKDTELDLSVRISGTGKRLNIRYRTRDGLISSLFLLIVESLWYL